MKRDSETDEEHSARLFGRTFGRQDSGASPFTGAPRESRIAHLAYLEACDTPRAKTAFRIGYLETFRGTKESGQ